MKAEALLPAATEAPTDSQRLFVRYFTAVLIDLLVLNLFVEYSKKVSVDSFTTSLLAAVLLQILLKVTIAIEHRVGAYFKAKPGRLMTFLRYFCAWLVLFGSKFVILEALSFAFGDKVRFEGRFHGLLTLIVVVVVMLVAEEAIVRLYRRLGNSTR
jgi:hypothetical protein